MRKCLQTYKMFNKNIKIAFFGNSEFSLLVLEQLKKEGVLPDLVVTTPDKPQGRKMILTATPTKKWAEENSVEYIEASKLKDVSFIEKIKKYNLFVVASYGKIIPKEILDIPQYKTLNIHPSLLPKYRGPSPLQEQILNNENNVGVTIMLVDEQVDHGPIILQEKINVADWPIGFTELREKFAIHGAVILAENLKNWINGKIIPKPQDDKLASFTKKVEKLDGKLDLNDNQYKNYLKYLAFNDWPKTYYEINKNDKKIRVIITKAMFKDDQFIIEKVIPEGKKEMSYQDFLRGNK